MSISYRTIIKQMISRLEKVKDNTENKEKLLQQIYHIHGLCELIMEEEKESSSINEFAQHDEKQLIEMIENKQQLTTISEEDNSSLLDF